MSDIHFHVLIGNFVKGILRHRLDGGENRGEMHTIGEGETALADVLCPDLTGEIIQPAENVGVDLLQAFDGPRHQGVQQTTVKERKTEYTVPRT